MYINRFLFSTELQLLFRNSMSCLKWFCFQFSSRLYRLIGANILLRDLCVCPFKNHEHSHLSTTNNCKHKIALTQENKYENTMLNATLVNFGMRFDFYVSFYFIKFILCNKNKSFFYLNANYFKKEETINRQSKTMCILNITQWLKPKEKHTKLIAFQSLNNYWTLFNNAFSAFFLFTLLIPTFFCLPNVFSFCVSLSHKNVVETNIEEYIQCMYQLVLFIKCKLIKTDPQQNKSVIFCINNLNCLKCIRKWTMDTDDGVDQREYYCEYKYV